MDELPRINDTPPPPFETEELDYGPSWGCLAGLFIIAVIAVAFVYVILAVGPD